MKNVYFRKLNIESFQFHYNSNNAEIARRKIVEVGPDRVSWVSTG
jgi:hypothetical protein